MVRVTQSRAIELENEAVALGYFEQALRELPDPRRAQGLRYPLRTVVVIALMSMVCGCDDAEAMEYWGKANANWLSTFLEVPHGVPSQDVFLNVFGALCPTQFSAVFQSWASLLTLRIPHEGTHIAIDGKTSRRSADKNRSKPNIHTVSAWHCGAGLVLAQRQTGEKSNEITAIPELLRVLDLKGATITIDAMGCQTEIASTIIAGGGDYLLAVRDNQPTLHAEVTETFRNLDDPRSRTVDERARPETRVCTVTEKGHGRLETRTVRVCTDLTWVGTRGRWMALSYVVEVTRDRTIISSGKSSHERVYYIGSGPPPSAQKAGHIARSHWAIENALHWTLDVAFGEDDARHRAKNTAANFTTLRHFALAVVKRDPERKLGVANSRKIAGFDRNCLIRIIRGA
jgi:predicted transposase YbfD/YdcC